MKDEECSLLLRDSRIEEQSVSKLKDTGEFAGNGLGQNSRSFHSRLLTARLAARFGCRLNQVQTVE